MPDHVHLLISIPPKYAVSAIVGYIKGKSAIAIASRGRERSFTGEKFWARGYFVSTVGRDEGVIRNYIKNQEQEDIRQIASHCSTAKTALGGSLIPPAVLEVALVLKKEKKGTPKKSPSFFMLLLPASANFWRLG